MVKKCLSRMSGKLSRTVLRRGKGSNPFFLVDYHMKRYQKMLVDKGIVMPAIELPDLGFGDMKSLKGVDLIAANVSTVQFIRGSEVDREAFDLDQRKVVLRHNGQIVNQGIGSDAMGSQWEAALWLVNQVISQGWKVEPGHVLLTGALGQMIPGKSGSYEADYGDFGKIVFEIR